jgi:hypothetical protein
MTYIPDVGGVIYQSRAAGTAKASFTTEIAINDTTGMGPVATVPAQFWTPNDGIGKVVAVTARGILSSTGTPTYTFRLRVGAAASITACIGLGSAALTTQSGITNQIWEFNGEFVVTALGAAGANSTIRGVGMLTCAGIASPFMAPLWGGGATPGTDATLDHSIQNYFNMNVACSASSASNTITLQFLRIHGLN